MSLKVDKSFQFKSILWDTLNNSVFPCCRYNKAHTCASSGVRNVRFSENLTCFVFMKHPFWDSLFCLITDDFSVVFIQKMSVWYKIIANLRIYLNFVIVFVRFHWYFNMIFWRPVSIAFFIHKFVSLPFDSSWISLLIFPCAKNDCTTLLVNCKHNWVCCKLHYLNLNNSNNNNNNNNNSNNNNNNNNNNSNNNNNNNKNNNNRGTFVVMRILSLVREWSGLAKRMRSLWMLSIKWT